MMSFDLTSHGLVVRCGRVQFDVHGETLPVLISKDIRDVQDGRSLCFLPSSKRLGRIRDVLMAISRCFCDPVMLTEIFGTVFARGGCSTPCALHPTSAHLVRASQPFAADLSNSFQPRPGDLLLVMSCWGATPCCMLQFRRGETKSRKGPHHTRKHKTKH